MFVGREDLIADMKMLWNKRVSSLITCRGRRRIGKSTLIEEFARRSGARLIKLEGLRPKPKMKNADELAFFATKLSNQTGCEKTSPSDWYSAFVRLEREINDDVRTVVLLDEISWMAFYDVTFPEVLKNAWDDLFKKHRKLVLVLCGSVSSWIRENIIDNGAYAGRRSADFVVPELPLKDCVKFWGGKALRNSSTEILDVLSVTGGVPRYLEEVNPALSANENIRRMGFLRKSLLATDFEEIFRDVFTGEISDKVDVLRTLAGASRNVSEIAAMLGKERNGHLSDVLNELREAGFISCDEGLNPETGRPVQQLRYRLSDNYARFYLRYMEPNLDMIERGAFANASLEQLGGWNSVLGLAFENLVVNNFRELLPKLGLERSLVKSAAPFRKGDPESGKGVQVDLLLQTARSIYLIEIKRQTEIGSEVIDEVDQKVRRIKCPKGTAVKTALVYDGCLARTVEADGYFDAIINFHDLLF